VTFCHPDSVTREYFDETMVNRQRLLFAIATRRQLERWEPLVAKSVRLGLYEKRQLDSADIWAAEIEHHFLLIAARNLFRALELPPPTNISIDATLRSELPFQMGCGRWFTGQPGAGYAYSSGTSFAAPIVAGVAALLWAARPELQNFQVADLLMRSASRPVGAGWSPDRGWGVVNAARALELATGSSSRDTVVINQFATGGPPKPSRVFAVTASVAWQDGVPVSLGTTSCEASVRGRILTPVQESFAPGSVSCAWRIPVNTGGRRIFGTVRVVDGNNNQAARGFSTVIRRNK
jgi:hypothetical protein